MRRLRTIARGVQRRGTVVTETGEHIWASKALAQALEAVPDGAEVVVELRWRNEPHDPEDRL